MTLCPWHHTILARCINSLPHLGKGTRRRLARDLAMACPECRPAHPNNVKEKP